MGTAPSHRRQGLGQSVLEAALDAAVGAGSRTIWLEVLNENTAAEELYRKLGFVATRELAVWSLPAAARPSLPARSLDDRTAQSWIAANRHDREPWQRCDATLAGCASVGRGDGRFSRVLDGLGADLLSRRHEMRLSLAR